MSFLERHRADLAQRGDRWVAAMRAEMIECAYVDAAALDALVETEVRAVRVVGCGRQAEWMCTQQWPKISWFQIRVSTPKQASRLGSSIRRYFCQVFHEQCDSVSHRLMSFVHTSFEYFFFIYPSIRRRPAFQCMPEIRRVTQWVEQLRTKVEAAIQVRWPCDPFECPL
jgi:hypothetical protein